MTIKIGYMGTKKYIAPYVADVLAQCQQGAVLDVFAGMGSVGEAVGESRSLWVNDIQEFAAEVGKALFSSKTLPPGKAKVHDELLNAYTKNYQALAEKYQELLKKESLAIQLGTVEQLVYANGEIVRAMNESIHQKERKRLQKKPDTFPYRLFSLSYSGRFFSLEQSMAIDSLRYAIDHTCAGLNFVEQRRWLLLALGVALVRVSTSTGHFAQYMIPKASNLGFVKSQRGRSVWTTFWLELERLAPIGSLQWRQSNRVFSCDATSLLQRMYLFDEKPAVIYADPPYTDDQYSRFYHLWETLIRYDYPESHGKGCYRPDRFCTPFALVSKVEAAIDDLSAAAARLGSQLIISYPANGLLSRKNKTVEEIVRRHYRKCERIVEIGHEHSTMGASNGLAKHKVKEHIFLARN